MPRVQAKGQVTLEGAFRDELGIRPGDEVEEFVLEPGQVVDRRCIGIAPRRPGFGRLRGWLGKGEGDVDAIMRELRGDPNP